MLIYLRESPTANMCILKEYDIFNFEWNILKFSNLVFFNK